jgi:hypothetical protein
MSVYREMGRVEGSNFALFQDYVRHLTYSPIQSEKLITTLFILMLIAAHRFLS